jgi:hypothetical protein
MAEDEELSLLDDYTEPVEEDFEETTETAAVQ